MEGVGGACTVGNKLPTSWKWVKRCVINTCFADPCDSSKWGNSVLESRQLRLVGKEGGGLGKKN